MILLEYFLFYIKKRSFDNIDNPLLSEENYMFIDSILDRDTKIKKYSNDNIKIIKKDENTLNIIYNNTDSTDFNDKLYSLGYLCSHLNKGLKKKLKFSTFDENCWLRKNWKYTKSFKKKILILIL